MLIAVVVLGLLGLVLLRGPKAPRGGYPSTRDPDDLEGGPVAVPGDLEPGTAPVPPADTRPALDRPESAASRMARLTAEITALRDDMLVLASMPTPHSTRSPTAHST